MYSFQTFFWSHIQTNTHEAVSIFLCKRKKFLLRSDEKRSLQRGRLSKMQQDMEVCSLLLISGGICTAHHITQAHVTASAPPRYNTVKLGGYKSKKFTFILLILFSAGFNLWSLSEYTDNCFQRWNFKVRSNCFLQEDIVATFSSLNFQNLKLKSISFHIICFNVKINQTEPRPQTQPCSLFSIKSNEYSVWASILFFLRFSSDLFSYREV